MTKILIVGYYGFGNTGDEAILGAMLKGLRKEIGKISAVVTSNDPALTSKLHGVESVYWRDVPAVINTAAGSDLLILGGGGIFEDYAGFDAEQYLSPVYYGISYYGSLPLLGTLLGLPVMIYGVGVGPLQSELGQKDTRAAFAQADGVTVRDPGSLEALREIGVDVEHVTLAADPALNLPLGNRATARKRLNKLGVSLDGKPLLGVALRSWTIGISEAYWTREVARALDRLLDRTECTPIFLPLQHGEGAIDDSRIARLVQEQMRHGKDCHLFSERLKPADIAAVICQCDLMFGMRLHSAILAAAGGVPSVMLAYDPKIRGFMSQIGCDDYCIDLSELDSERIAGMLNEALSGRDGLSSRLQEKVKELRRLAASSAHISAEILNSRSTKADAPEGDVQELVRRVALVNARKFNLTYEELRQRKQEIEQQRTELEAARKEAQAREEELSTLQAQETEINNRLARRLEERQLELNRLRESMAGARNRLTNELEEYRQKARAERKRLSEALEATQGRLREVRAAADTDRSRLSNELDALSERYASDTEKMRQELSRAYEIIQGYNQSRSWKLTRPFRVTAKLLRRLVGRPE